jgi:hypothetical protein
MSPLAGALVADISDSCCARLVMYSYSKAHTAQGIR